MTLESFMTLIGFTATIFGLGYMIGQNHSKKQ